MAYYDALIAKWAELTGESPAQSLIDQARAALTLPTPERPTAEEQEADAEAYPRWLAALNAWHQSWAGIFQHPFVLAKLQQINALPDGWEPKRIDVSVADVIGYLALHGELVALKVFASNPPQGAAPSAVGAAASLALLISTPSISSFRTSDPATFAAVKANLDALVVSGLITQANEDALLAMTGGQPVPWWQTAGYASPIGSGDLEAVFDHGNGRMLV